MANAVSYWQKDGRGGEQAFRGFEFFLVIICILEAWRIFLIKIIVFKNFNCKHYQIKKIGVD